MNRENDASAKELRARLGDPVERVMEVQTYWYNVWTIEIAKPSRHKNWKKIREAQDVILRCTEVGGDFIRPKYKSINHSGDVALTPMVIRAPEREPDSKKWLRKYAPKDIDLNKIEDTGGKTYKLIQQPAAEVLKPVVAEYNSKVSALNSVDDVISEWDRKFLAGY